MYFLYFIAVALASIQQVVANNKTLSPRALNITSCVHSCILKSPDMLGDTRKIVQYVSGCIEEGFECVDSPPVGANNTKVGKNITTSVAKNLTTPGTTSSNNTEGNSEGEPTDAEGGASSAQPKKYPSFDELKNTSLNLHKRAVVLPHPMAFIKNKEEVKDCFFKCHREANDCMNAVNDGDAKEKLVKRLRCLVRNQRTCYYECTNKLEAKHIILVRVLNNIRVMFNETKQTCSPAAGEDCITELSEKTILPSLLIANNGTNSTMSE